MKGSINKLFLLKFESIATRAHWISKEALKEIYISGVNLKIQEKLILARPKDINDAFSLANMCDEARSRQEKKKSKYDYI